MQELSGRVEQAAGLLDNEVAVAVKAMSREIKPHIQEIRLRLDSPLSIFDGSKNYFLEPDGRCNENPGRALLITKRHIRESFRRLCGYSVHSHETEIPMGFISVEGGHRAGLCGIAVMEQGRVSTLRDITSINLRIARQIQGAADQLIRRTMPHGMPGGLLIVGSPGSGKTTLLRDLARQLSTGIAGSPQKVVVIDERYELSGAYAGRIHNDLGPCTDLLCGIPKGQAIMMAVRSMSPQIILCDEIGTMEEIEAVRASLGCGVRVITTMHAGCWGELVLRPQFKPLISTGAFSQVVLLQGEKYPCQIADIKKSEDFHA